MSGLRSSRYGGRSTHVRLQQTHFVFRNSNFDIRSRTSSLELRSSTFALRYSCSLAKRNGSHGKSGHSAFDLVRGRNVTELVASVARQLFQVVKLANVNTLFDQQVLMHGIETAAP